MIYDSRQPSVGYQVHAAQAWGISFGYQRVVYMTGCGMAKHNTGITSLTVADETTDYSLCFTLYF